MAETLTKEQEAKVEEIKAEWKEIGLSTEPIDYDKAKEHLTNLYKSAGITTKKLVFLRTRSPMGAIFAYALVLSFAEEIEKGGYAA